MKVSTTNIQRDIKLVSIDTGTSTCVIRNCNGTLEEKKIKSIIIEFET